MKHLLTPLLPLLALVLTVSAFTAGCSKPDYSDSGASMHTAGIPQNAPRGNQQEKKVELKLTRPAMPSATGGQK